MTLVRIQRRRSKGWKMPENTISVTRPGKWGNPFNWQDGLAEGYSEEMSKQLAVQFYLEWILP